MESYVEEYIKKYEAEINLNFSHLIKIPSVVERDESEFPYGKNAVLALNFCEALCRQKGFSVKGYDNRCIKASINHQRHGKEILFAAHSDVVPPDNDCLYPPFLGKIVDGYMVGRGSVDDKGPLIAILYALNFYKEQNIKLKNNFSLLIGSNEEGGMDDIDYYLSKEDQPKLAISVDDDFPVVKGENSKLIFSLKEKVNCRVKSIICKKDLRRSYPFECMLMIDREITTFDVGKTVKNPLTRMLLDFKEKNIPLFKDKEINRIIEKVILENEGKVIIEKGGELKITLTNAVLGEDELLKLTFTAICPPTLDAHSAAEELLKKSKELKMNLFLDKADIGYCRGENDEVSRLLTNVYNHKMGGNFKPYVMTGSTYSRKFKNALGFGGGNPAEEKPFPKGHGACHGPDEAHSIKALHDAIRVYILAIEELDKYFS